MSFLEAVSGWLGYGGFSVSPGLRARLQGLAPAFRQVSRETGIPAPLLAGIAMKESSLRPEVQGPPIEFQGGQRAKGLMQVTPTTARALGLPPDWDWTDPLTNIRAGARVLEDKGFGHDPIRTVLARYGGFVTVDPGPYIDKVLTWAVVFAPDLL